MEREELMTWNDIAVQFPEFVQWVVITQGPLPDGEVRQEDYDKFRTAYQGEEK